MFENEDRIVARPKVAIVRDFLDAGHCVSMNPFLRGIDREQLLDVFDEFASDVKRAAAKLEELTGANPLAFGGAPAEAGAKARALAALAESAEKVDITLSNAFQAEVGGPFFALRELEQMEAENGSPCFGRAQRAMDGLAGLYALARAVPLVYEQVSRDDAPALAVA